MEWCYLFLIRLTLAEVTTRANIAFVPQTPIALADSIELIEIAVPFPKPLDINWSAFKNFSKTLKEMETRVWREAQWEYCNNQKLNGIVENSQNTLITSLQKDISEIEEDRTQLIRDVKIFANSTKLSIRKRRSITLLAAGAAAALVLEPIVEKTAYKMLSNFHLCQDSEEKMRRIASHLDSMEYKLHHLTSDTDNTIHILGNENLKQKEQMKTILNYTAGNFGTVENAVNNLEQDMEQVQQAQVCDHKRSDVFTFFLQT